MYYTVDSCSSQKSIKYNAKITNKTANGKPDKLHMKTINLWPRFTDLQSRFYVLCNWKISNETGNDTASDSYMTE